METEDLKLYRDSAWTDLKVRFCGHSKCLPLHTYGPGSRPYYLMHFVFSGKGRLIVNQKEYQVEAGQLFLVEPNQMVFYQADEYDPWSYSWVGFQGTLAKHFLGRLGLGYPALTRIISGQILCEIKDLLCQMAENHGDKVSDDLYINGLFLILLSKIQTANAAQNNPNISGNPAESFVQQAVSIVENFYGTELTVKDISKKLNLNRSYLSTIFAKYTGISLKKYIVDFRISQSEEFLFTTNWSVDFISKVCGFNNPSYFSKIFKNKHNASPSEYRNLREKM